MIEASFDGTKERSAAASGAYQYDTGQRLRMHGLPSPGELAERDDFLAGDMATVQAQYAYAGDSQTEMRLAVYDEEGGVWTAAVPDAYLTRSEDVHVYVYVSYGQTDESVRAKTCYEAVFRPIGRPAPGSEVTPDQMNAWDALVREINLTISDTKTAASGANAAAELVNNRLDKLDMTRVGAEALPEGSEPTVVIEDKGTHKAVTFGIPAGATGAQGVPGVVRINGYDSTNEGEITLTAKDVGALPDTHRTVFEFTAVIPANAAGTYQRIDVEGILATDRPVADIDMDAVKQEDLYAVQKAWANVTGIAAYDGFIAASNLLKPILTAVPVRLLCVR